MDVWEGRLMEGSLVPLCLSRTPITTPLQLLLRSSDSLNGPSVITNLESRALQSGGALRGRAPAPSGASLPDSTATLDPSESKIS